MRDRIVEEARALLGTRWKHQGRSREAVDCVGLVVMVGRAVGIKVADFTDYQRRPDSANFLAAFKGAGGIRKPVAQAEPGDVLVLRETAYPCHCGILTEKNGKPHLLHSHAGRRIVTEEPLAYWLDKRVAAFAYPGID